MLQGKGLSNCFWAEAINIAVYLKNRSPTKSLNFKTPFEVFSGYKPRVNHLRVFGSKAFAHIPKYDRKKLDPKAMKCIFVGYSTDFKAYKLFNPLTIKFLRVEICYFMSRLRKEIRRTTLKSGTFHY